MISYDEAERRSSIYNHKHSSYLFDLNTKLCVDGYRLGSKTKYFNHARHPALVNVAPVVVSVNGEHRIKFVASKTIPIGHELVFDYGKSFAEKQGLHNFDGIDAKGQNAKASNSSDKNRRALEEALANVPVKKRPGKNKGQDHAMRDQPAITGDTPMCDSDELCQDSDDASSLYDGIDHEIDADKDDDEYTPDG